MPEDLTRVDPCIFHDFHLSWVATLHHAFNTGGLPSGFYALAEQHGNRPLAEVLALNASVEASGLTNRRRSVAIRHISNHRLVALIEIVSPANKDRAESVDEFVAKSVSALRVGVNLLVVDLFPPSPHGPYGVNGTIRQRLEDSDEPYDLPADEPLTLAGYAAGLRVEAFLEHVAFGTALPDMPLFLRPDRYVNVPLETTYQAAYRGMPAFWRHVLEGRPPQGL
jgi:hypothetical protein